jgi:uncharacterized OB-fold protein
VALVSGNNAPAVVAPGLLRDVDGSPRLVGSTCTACERPAFPASSICPWCGNDRTDETELAPTGTLWGWTAVTAAPPGYVGSTPFGFGIVQLDDGLRVITRLTESDPSALTFGEPMTLVYDAVDQHEDGTDVVTWAFAPSRGT